jgi:hypothetical protein
VTPKRPPNEILSIQQLLDGVIVDIQMTPKQYVDAIDRLGLSQRAAGAFLGVDERQSRRWVAGDSAIPESVAKMLRLMVRLKLTPEDVR